MQDYGGWEVIKPLGGGGQNEVYLVRSPARASMREKCLDDLRKALDGDKRLEIAESLYSYARFFGFHGGRSNAMSGGLRYCRPTRALPLIFESKG
jgi:hypothetical protein